MKATSPAAINWHQRLPARNMCGDWPAFHALTSWQHHLGSAYLSRA